MALNKVAIVKGEWQVDHDGVVRLYVRPSIIIVEPGGTYHVSSLAEPDGRRSDPPRSSPGVVFCPTTHARENAGVRYWQTEIPEDGFRLEPQAGLTAITLGVYTENCSPFVALLVTKTGIIWDPARMDPWAIPAHSVVSINQYDQHFIEPLKRLRCNERRTTAVENSEQG